MTTRSGSPHTTQPEAIGDAPRGKLYSLRVRLLSIVALSLSPLLALSAVQAYVEYHSERADRRARLILTAQNAAETAETIITGAQPLLEALRSQEAISRAEPSCGQTFRTALLGVQSYSNIVRIGPDDRILCSALAFRDADGVGGGDWLEGLKRGDDFALSAVFTGALSQRAVMLAGVPVRDDEGRYDGAVAISIDVGAIPRLSDASLGGGATPVALADREGRVFSGRDEVGVSTVPAATINAALETGGVYWDAPEREFGTRDFVVAPLFGEAVFVIISTEQLGWIDWAIIDVTGTVLLPLVMWLLALAAVAVATDRMVLRWVLYLQRIAQLYAGGRLRVAPSRARAAPAEFRMLASTLDSMASAIAAREDELEDALEQKTALLREVHHRVKNNLQIIISLLNIQMARSEKNPQVVATLEDARARINALALVHKRLYEAEDVRLIRLKQFLEELMTQLASASGAALGDAKLELDVDDVELTPEAAVPLALFATESATNAFKHAFAGRTSGVVRVRLKRLDDHTLRLDVEDDGVGWPADPEPDGQGVGHSLMAAFRRQLGGRMERGESDLGGARITLTFPFKPPADAD